MNEPKLKNLSKFIKKVASHKPKEPPKKPKHQPSKTELEKVYTLNLKKGKIV